MLPYPGEYVKKQKYYNFKKITIANFLKMCNNIKCKINRGVAQFGRAPRSGRGGRKFKSCHLDQKKQDTVWYPVFFIAARFELADEFPNTQPRSGAGVREEPPEEVPIKSGKSESPRPFRAGFKTCSLFRSLHFYLELFMRNNSLRWLALTI